MFNAADAAAEFPFVETLPKREKSKLAMMWEQARRLSQIIEEVGALVPQHLVAEVLGVSKQRVGQFVDEGRLENVEFCGVRYCTERSVLAFAKIERKITGRPPHKPSNRALWKAARSSVSEMSGKK